jgi:hypothetical protein
LVAFDLQGVYLLILNNVEILLHLQLALQLCEIISVVFFDGNYVLLGLEIGNCFLLQIDQDMVLQLFDILASDLQLLLGLVQKGLELGNSKLLVDFRSILDLLGGNTKTERGDSFSQIVRMRRAGNNQSGF